MIPSILQLPPELRDEYRRERDDFFRARVSFYCPVATLLYFLASAQYWVRQIFSPMELFRPAGELPILAFLAALTAVAWAVSRRARSILAAKLCAAVFIVGFAGSMTAYGIVYHEHAMFFVFYYGAAMILTALMLPWGRRETLALAAVFTAGFTAYLVLLERLTGNTPFEFPRFHPYLDGWIYLFISGAVSYVVRSKDIQRDLDHFRLRKRIEQQTRQFEKELELADRVHKTLIPASAESPKADVAVTYLPMHYIGGDCGKFRFLDDDRLLIFISDVTGHGVPAALLVNRVHAEFERIVRETGSPGRLLKELNRFIFRDFEGTRMYLSAFCGVIDFKKRSFAYSNYGHPSQYLYRLTGGEPVTLSSQTSFLGILFDEAECYEREVRFEPGDSFLLFTDGVTETVGPGGEFFGEARLVDFVRSRAGEASARFNESLVDELRRFSGGRFNDDVFILNIKTKAFRPAPAAREPQTAPAAGQGA